MRATPCILVYTPSPQTIRFTALDHPQGLLNTDCCSHPSLFDSVCVRRGGECALLTSSPVMLIMQVPGHTLRIDHLYTQITQLGRLRSQSHNLLSASWTTGKAGGVIQKGWGEGEKWRGCWWKSHRLKTPEPGVLFPKAGEDKRPSSKREKISCPLPFCSTRVPDGLDEAHPQ